VQVPGANDGRARARSVSGTYAESQAVQLLAVAAWASGRASLAYPQDGATVR